jgi:hypothetical protein
MSNVSGRTDIKIAVGHVSALAKVFAFAATLGGAVVLARVWGVDQVSALGGDVPVGGVWILFLAITVAHWYLAITATASFDDVLEQEHNIHDSIPKSELTAEVLYQEIRSQNTVFLRGLLARAPTAGGRLWKMSWQDPTTLIFIALCLLDFVAIIPWRRSTEGLEWTTGSANVAALLIMGVVLIVVNWMAGSLWTTAVSELRLPLRDVSKLDLGTGLSTPIGNEFGCIIILVAVILGLTAIPLLLVRIF